MNAGAREGHHRGTTTIFEALRESHEEQRRLCRALVTSKELGHRDPIFQLLQLELEAHAAAEERSLYVPLLMTDAGLSSSRHALAEHHEIEELVDEMRTRNKRSDAWLGKAKELGKLVRHHLKEEESKFFQVAGRALTDAKKVTLAKSYLREIARMKIHLTTSSTGHG